MTTAHTGIEEGYFLDRSLSFRLTHFKELCLNIIALLCFGKIVFPFAF